MKSQIANNIHKLKEKKTKIANAKIRRNSQKFNQTYLSFNTKFEKTEGVNKIKNIKDYIDEQNTMEMNKRGRIRKKYIIEDIIVILMFNK